MKALGAGFIVLDIATLGTVGSAIGAGVRGVILRGATKAALTSGASNVVRQGASREVAKQFLTAGARTGARGSSPRKRSNSWRRRLPWEASTTWLRRPRPKARS